MADKCINCRSKPATVVNGKLVLCGGCAAYFATIAVEQVAEEFDTARAELAEALEALREIRSRLCVSAARGWAPCDQHTPQRLWCGTCIAAAVLAKHESASNGRDAGET